MSFSAVSMREIAIEAGLGPNDLSVRLDQFLQIARKTGFVELPLTASVATGVASLPRHHKGSFGQLLMAQAMDEPARLLTADPQLAAYTGLVQMVSNPA